jgi:leucyl aminopeptidase
MKISVSSALNTYDALFIFVPEKKWNSKIYGSLLTKPLEKHIANVLKRNYFKGTLGELLELQSDSGRVFVCGTGKGKEKIDMRKAAGVAIRKAKKIESKKVSFLIADDMDVLRFVSGSCLGNYEFKIGDTSKQFSPEILTIVSPQKVSKKDLESEIALAEATNTTRDMVNLPANKMTPSILADRAKSFGKTHKSVKVNILGEKEIQKLGMGALYNVGVGSHEESRVIVFEYMGGQKKDAPMAFVGKGVTFDAGGYNLKPTNHIETMKCDMAGAATVFGIFEWIARTKPQKKYYWSFGSGGELGFWKCVQTR